MSSLTTSQIIKDYNVINGAPDNEKEQFLMAYGAIFCGIPAGQTLLYLATNCCPFSD